jgi:hypothetical protein
MCLEEQEPLPCNPWIPGRTGLMLVKPATKSGIFSFNNLLISSVRIQTKEKCIGSKIKVQFYKDNLKCFINQPDPNT